MSSRRTDYLTVAEIAAIHSDLIERYGGAADARDPGQLEAALFRPQTGYYADEIAQAAALWESLSQNHAFIDGNKRVAFAAMFAFLTVLEFHLSRMPTKRGAALLRATRKTRFASRRWRRGCARTADESIQLTVQRPAPRDDWRGSSRAM